MLRRQPGQQVHKGSQRPAASDSGADWRHLWRHSSDCKGCRGCLDQCSVGATVYMKRDSSVPAVVAVGSKAAKRSVADPERGLLGIPRATCSSGDSLESADYVETHRSIAGRRKDQTVASSVQETEDCAGTGISSMDWWVVA